jgi:hypothetical protein
MVKEIKLDLQALPAVTVLVNRMRTYIGELDEGELE